MGKGTLVENQSWFTMDTLGLRFVLRVFYFLRQGFYKKEQVLEETWVSLIPILSQASTPSSTQTHPLARSSP